MHTSRVPKHFEVYTLTHETSEEATLRKNGSRKRSKGVSDYIERVNRLVENLQTDVLKVTEGI